MNTIALAAAGQQANELHWRVGRVGRVGFSCFWPDLVLLGQPVGRTKAVLVVHFNTTDTMHFQNRFTKYR